MKISRYILGAFLILMHLLPTCAAADAGEQAFSNAKAAYRQLQNSSKSKLYRENWSRVIHGFDGIVKSYPHHRRADDALYLGGKASEGLYTISRRKADARQAVDFYDRLARGYSEGNLADDACYLAGSILERQLQDRSGAYQRYKLAVDNHGQGDMTPLCRDGVKRLKAFASSHSDPDSPAAVSSAGARRTNLKVHKIRYWSSPDYTRVVIETSRPGKFTSHLLQADPREGQPPRLYVDIEGCSVAKQVPAAQKVGDGLLRDIRVGMPKKNLSRVVLDLETYDNYKVFSLENPQRIVIDVSGQRQASLKAAKPELHAPPSGASDAIATVLERAPLEKPLKVTLPASAVSGGLRRIVVDAGHGGKDPGAIGPSGVMEKDVTLAMAKRLARRLEKDLGCQVILTRDKDVFLPLEERTAIANRVGADLFISIHANASKNRSAQGVETYYLNFSKNDKAAAVAARENGTSLKEVSDLELILFDLMANAKINESSRLAAEIQKNLVDGLSRHYSHVKNHGVRQGPFYVLLGANMPSVLVETAFISNKTEEARLRSSKYQDHAAHAIARAVHTYSQDSKTIANK
jgi:N-acetylmuramoyl-L-alanine amidase